MAAERRQPQTPSFRTFWLILALGVSASACVGGTNPVTGKRDWTLVGERQELELGHQAHQEILNLYGYYADPKLQEYVSEVGWALVPHSHRPELDYRFTVLDTDMVNALATPGYVYITRGLLALLNSEAELAGVLGHELAHITARHAAQRIGQQQTVDIIKLVLDATTGSALVDNTANILGQVYLSGYGRENELEADRLGARYAALAGYDPEALVEVMHILENQEDHEIKMARMEGRKPQINHGLFATHPDNEDRVEEVAREADRHRSGSGGLVRRAEYLRHIDGMAVGPAEFEGQLRGRYFYHRTYNFTVAFPQGWETANFRDRLVAQPLGRDLQIRLTLIERNARQPSCDFLQQKFENLARLRAGATDGFSGCQAQVWDNESAADVLVLEHSPGIFLLVAAQSDRPEAFRRYAREIQETFQSLRPLTKDEYDTARSPQLKIVEAQSGDTYAGLAKGADWDPYPEDQLRLFNAAYPSGEPIPGESVKTVH